MTWFSWKLLFGPWFLIARMGYGASVWPSVHAERCCGGKALSRIRRSLGYKPGSRTVEIRDRLLDLAPAIRVGNQVCPASGMYEDASFQNVRIWIIYCGDFFPLGALLEIGPHSKRRTPIQILCWIIAVSKCRWHRNNPLVCSVSKRYKHVNQPRRGWAAALRASKNINP
jgi:hypothetical protein